jgi:hypothetical protein
MGSRHGTLADVDALKLSQQLVMTPQLQMAIRLLATPSDQLPAMIADWQAQHPGALVPLATGEPDPADDAERGGSPDDDPPPFLLLDDPPLPIPADGRTADVFVFGNPPEARANRATLPRVRVAPDATADAARDATWLVRSLRQRLRSYENIVRAVVALRPELAVAVDPSTVAWPGTRAVAERVGMHESTVERVRSACTFQTVHGVYALRTVLEKPRRTSRPRRNRS